MTLADAAATERAGAALAQALPRDRSLLITLAGELGSGKTTFARGVLRALGVTGPIRSPSYTLVEPYETGAGPVHHLDLYRLRGGAGELEALGYRDLRALPGWVMVEWPERAQSALGVPDVALTFEHLPEGRRLTADIGRHLRIPAYLADMLELSVDGQ